MITDRAPFVVAELEPDPELTAAPVSGTHGTDGWYQMAPATGTGDGTDWYRRAGTDDAAPVPAGGTCASVPGTDGTGTDLVPVLAAPQRISLPARLGLSLREQAALLIDSQKRHRTFWHAVTVFACRPPETWAETHEHLKSRKWLQDYMTGWVRTLIEWENLAFGYLVAIPAKIVLQSIEKIFFERQLGFWLAVAFIALCAGIRLLTS